MSTAVAPTREREGHRVAEAVGEEELRGREDDVVLADAEDAARVELGGVDEVRVEVHGALGVPVDPDE